MRTQLNRWMILGLATVVTGLGACAVHPAPVPPAEAQTQPNAPKVTLRAAASLVVETPLVAAPVEGGRDLLEVSVPVRNPTLNPVAVTFEYTFLGRDELPIPSTHPETVRVLGPGQRVALHGIAPSSAAVDWRLSITQTSLPPDAR